VTYNLGRLYSVDWTVGLDSQKVALIIWVTKMTQEKYSFHLLSIRVFVATQLSF